MSYETTSPFIDEHMSGGSSNATNTGYNPDEEEKKIIRMVEKFYKKSKDYKKKYDEKWMDYYKMFRGKQWKELRPAYRHSEVLNLVFQTIESMVPILTDSRPKLEFVPSVPSDPALSNILNKVAENDWERGDWLSILTEIIYDAHFYGTGLGFCGYDPEENQGLGNILFESQDPFNAFPDPSARDINERRSLYYIDAEPIDVKILKKKYPRKAQYIEPDVTDFEKGDKTDITQSFFKSPVDQKLYIQGDSGGDASNKDKVLQITCYFKDDEVYECVDEEASTEEKQEMMQKLKYPNGRKIVIASGVLLEDVPIPFDDGKFPYIKLTNYELPREFWGISEVEQLEGPQKTINKLISFALDYMTLMGNPIWVVGSTANIDTDNLINKPGLIVETDDPNAVRREQGVQLPAFILQLVDRYKQYIDGVSGQTDLSRGATNGQVSAASAIQELQEAQQTRLRLKSRNIDKFLQQFGRMYISRVFQFYSVPRIVRVTGDLGAEKYFHFHVESIENPDGTVKRMAHITDPDDTDEAGLPMTKVYEIMGDFDVRVSTGSSLPFAKDQKGGQSMNLYKLGVIDDEELLKNLDYPNYQEVVRRNNEKKAQAAEMQMKAAEAQLTGTTEAQMALQNQKIQGDAQIQQMKSETELRLEVAKQISDAAKEQVQNGMNILT